MRRARKPAVLLGAGLLALVVTFYNRGEEISAGTHAPIRAAVSGQAAAYDLSGLPIFTRTLFHVRESYFDKARLNPRRMLVGALDFLQRDVPEIIIDREPERDPKKVTVKVNGQEKEFSLEGVEAPWSLRTKLQEIFKFIQPNLQAVSSPKEEARRLVEIEAAATNGMLYTLDPHSVLLDVESFKEMRMTTQGKFGGLGIVIMMDRKGRIMVRKPMPGTPAFEAGLKPKDHIVRINSESTVNMTLTEAVERLRGEVGDPVDVYIDRDPAAAGKDAAKTEARKPKKFTIVRAAIRPPSIDPPAEVLLAPPKNGKPGAKIGYFRMQSFTANTERDLADALALFEKEKVKGIIMDLRTNPGGLYDQAQKVADAFIDSGVLVSMVGVGGTQRRDEHASRGGDVKAPLAVLVNQYSASASEIVAGAMKHLDRGVVIGETTFGKGSVQMLFDVNSPVRLGKNGGDDKLGLKLTTAQYLTAGDISIQGVGVAPDIALEPMHVNLRKAGEESWIMLQPSHNRRQESDYEWSLANPTDTQATKPVETVSFLREPSPAQMAQAEAEEAEEEAAGGALDEEAPPVVEEEFETGDKVKVDFTIEFARDMLAQARGGRRAELVESSKAYFETVRQEQDKKVGQALEKLGVDWSRGPASPPEGELEMTLAPEGGSAKVMAGDKMTIRGTVKNTGKTPLYRVRAVLHSENGLFDENEMVFGKIEPGASKTYDLHVKVPKSMVTRADRVRAEVSAQGAIKSNDAQMVVDVTGKKRPLFAYTYQTIDDVQGNGDGRVQKGERVRLLVKVKNIGPGAALRPEATVRNGSGQDGILISAGRFERKEELPPGGEWTTSFVYEVGADFEGQDYALDLTVVDSMLGESVTDKIKETIAPPGRAPESATGTVTVSRRAAELREAPVEGSLAVGRAQKGAVFKVTGRVGAFTRVELEKDHPAFIATADLQPGGTANPKYDADWQVMPPLLAAAAPTWVTGESVQVKGNVSDDRQVRDVFIKVWNKDSKMPPKKVFYKRNTGDARQMSFQTDVPLWPGSNLIQVFARETNEVLSTQTLVVRRDGARLAKRTGP